MEDFILRNEVNFKPKLIVVRNILFESALLLQPAKVVDRRCTIDISKAPKRIPIGARGRRRASVLFIGLRPNLDGNKSTQPPQPAIPQPQASPPPPPQQQPARMDPVYELEAAFGSLHI